MAQLLSERALVREVPAGASPGAFCGLRLLPGPELSAKLERLCELLASEVLQRPPKYDLQLALGGWSYEDKVTRKPSLPGACGCRCAIWLIPLRDPCCRTVTAGGLPDTRGAAV